MSATGIEGGCLCGTVRYRVTAAPIHLSRCHCGSCRRASGASYVPWLTVAKSAFEFVEGVPAQYRCIREDGKEALRSFCARCGTQLTYEDELRPGELDVTTGTADDPEPLAPTIEVNNDEKLSWLR